MAFNEYIKYPKTGSLHHHREHQSQKTTKYISLCLSILSNLINSATVEADIVFVFCSLHLLPLLMKLEEVRCLPGCFAGWLAGLHKNNLTVFDEIFITDVSWDLMDIYWRVKIKIQPYFSALVLTQRISAEFTSMMAMLIILKYPWFWGLGNRLNIM